MFSKEESRKLREEFWIAFGKSYPRKWILYKTGVKGLSLKFYFDVKKAQVALDMEGNLEQRIRLWEKLVSLKTILEEYVPDANFEEYYLLANGKEISRIFVEKQQVSIHDKNTWQETMVFLSSQMHKVEVFFREYADSIRV
ncbi:MAG: DUF4268 domain-containing protein [Bacteroidota bacterium]